MFPFRNKIGGMFMSSFRNKVGLFMSPFCNKVGFMSSFLNKIGLLKSPFLSKLPSAPHQFQQLHTYANIHIFQLYVNLW